jgi:hypothetical protein
MGSDLAAAGFEEAEETERDFRRSPVAKNRFIAFRTRFCDRDKQNSNARHLKTGMKKAANKRTNLTKRYNRIAYCGQQVLFITGL